MKKRNIYFIIVALLVIALSLSIGLIVNQTYPLPTNTGNLFFVISLIAINVLTLFALIYLVIKEFDPSETLIIIGATLLLQGLPWINRLQVRSTTPHTIWAIFTLSLSLTIYIALVLSIDVISNKTKKARITLRGESIQVKKENEYLDANGNFVGTNKDKDVK